MDDPRLDPHEEVAIFFFNIFKQFGCTPGVNPVFAFFAGQNMTLLRDLLGFASNVLDGESFKKRRDTEGTFQANRVHPERQRSDMVSPIMCTMARRD